MAVSDPNSMFYSILRFLNSFAGPTVADKLAFQRKCDTIKPSGDNDDVSYN